MQIHNIKLELQYVEQKFALGIKDFEIRHNDRNYEIGDIVHYIIVCDSDKPVTPDMEERVKYYNKYYNDNAFQIVNLTDYAQQDNYVVWQEQKLRKIRKDK